MMNHFETNRLSWNIRTDIHIKSDFYDNDNFIKGKSSLNQIELDLLKNIEGKKILHLQCHFGQDTISLQRLGANVTGIDLSDNAIKKAKELAEETNSDVRFICCNVYDLPQHLDEQFDMVFTSYGTIVWLPDLDKWASIIARFLKPGGEFIFAEFHPFIWMYDDNFQGIDYSYFNKGEIVETEEGTYTDSTSTPKLKTITWNHSLSEVFNSLIQNGLTIAKFSEYDYSPYNCFSNTYEAETGKFRIQAFKDRVPMTYSILAIK